MLMEKTMKIILKEKILKCNYLRPFEIINQSTEYDARCNVKGGGLTGQVGAMVHGISKALLMFDIRIKTHFKKRET